MEFIKLSCVMITAWLGVWTQRTAGQGPGAEVVNAAVGQTVTLTAPVTTNIQLIYWYRGPIIANSQLILIYDVATSKQTNGTQYTGRETPLPDGSLRIRDLTTNYSGDYTVNIIENGGTATEAIRQLRVYENLFQPSLVNISGLDYRGFNLTLKCEARNQTVERYLFLKDNVNITCDQQRITCTESSPFLYFHPLMTSDSGTYTCGIHNPVSSSTSHPLEIRVKEPISDVTISSNVTTGHLWENEGSVNLTCSALGTDPIFSWMYNGSALPQDPRYLLSSDKSSLVISPVTRRDSGPFVCTASNLVNNQSSQPFLIDISYPISNVTISSNVTSGHLWENEGSVNLTCSALGTGPIFSWTFNGIALPQDPRYHLSPDGSSLVISPVTRGDTGPFVCTASNPANTLSSQPFLLTISLRPSGGIQCGAQSISDSHVELSCSWPGGSPPAEVRLQLPPSIDANATNEVKRNVSRSDITPSMTLTCRGAQDGYTDNCSLALGLPQDPGFKDNTTLAVTGGQQVALAVNLMSRSSSRVSSAAVLPATFTWFNGTSSIASDGRVEITSNVTFSQMVIANVMESDSGHYVCRAENPMGATSFSFRVHVSPAPGTTTTPGGLSAGAIAGIVVGVLAVVVIVGVTVYCVLKKKKDKKLRTSNRNEPGDPNVLQMKDTPKQDEINYAVLKFNNTNVQTPQPDYPNANETLYAQVRKN